MLARRLRFSEAMRVALTRARARTAVCSRAPTQRRRRRMQQTLRDRRPRVPVAFAAALAAAAVLIASPPARACDLCAIYTGSLMQQDKTGVMLGVAEQYTDFASIREDNQSVPNEA